MHVCKCNDLCITDTGSTDYDQKLNWLRTTGLTLEFWYVRNEKTAIMFLEIVPSGDD